MVIISPWGIFKLAATPINKRVAKTSNRPKILIIAAQNESYQTFNIILPNLIHRYKKKKTRLPTILIFRL